MTNGDKIRSMSDVELSEWLTNGGGLCDCCDNYKETGCTNPDCQCGVLRWLKKETKNEKV